MNCSIGYPKYNFHSFHIPVMGTAFTIDSPIKVAKYGINSVISLVDDTLIEQIRKYYCKLHKKIFKPISIKEEDWRAKRITAYLNLVDEIIKKEKQFIIDNPNSKSADFFIKNLPSIELRKKGKSIKESQDLAAWKEFSSTIPLGRIETNIMTKLDNIPWKKGRPMDKKYSEAISAFRGFANSDINGAIVFSAGMNPRLFSTISEFKDFYPDKKGYLKKQIVLKVSDFRSCDVQSSYLAKRGIWVSEFRIESGLNCGGHAFPSQGQLLGPILSKIKEHRNQLYLKLKDIYINVIKKIGKETPKNMPSQVVSCQGGIGNSYENNLLLNYFKMDRTGWGSPFLLVPDATNIDPFSLAKLKNAKEKQVVLSKSSPLGIPFWNFMLSDSEIEREERIKKGKPGSACPKGHLRLQTEFQAEAECAASKAYIKKKAGKSNESEDYLLKSCICHDLGGAVLLKHNIIRKAFPAICPGPNIVYFDKEVSLNEMIDHIYGYDNIITSGYNRPHMFIKELILYIDYLQKKIETYKKSKNQKELAYCEKFLENIQEGMIYYQTLFEQDILQLTPESQRLFKKQKGRLEIIEQDLKVIS